MNSNYSLRPEDFRLAWANAYQRALGQVAEMQRDSDRQLVAVKELLEVSAQQTEFGRTNLERSARVLVTMMRSAGNDCVARIDESRSKFEDDANRLMAEQHQLLGQMERLMNQLERIQRQLAADRSAMQKRTLGRRICDVFKLQG